MRRLWLLAGIAPWLVGGIGCGRGPATPGSVGSVGAPSAPDGGGGAIGSGGQMGVGVGGDGGGPGGGPAAGAVGGGPGGAAGAGAAGTGGGSTGAAGSVSPRGCSDLFDPGRLIVYGVDISTDEWAKMDYEFRNRAALQAAGQSAETYHPVVFHDGDEVVANASIRLKGQSSWDHTVALDGANAKMQFVIAFDQIDTSAKFHGVDKVTLDMPRDDATFLQERLAFATLAGILGLPAPCANSARLSINGQYYGLYIHEEHAGHGYLKRVFPEAPDGDLFKGGWTPETNKLAPNLARLDAFWAARDITAMAAIVDLDDSVTEWAAEALLNDADGYYGGGHNFLLYDYPGRGYRWLVYDADATFGWLGTSEEHPIYWWIAPRSTLQQPGQHYLVAMRDPTWRAHYLDKLRGLLARWDAGTLQGWIDAWSAQIADAVAEDPHKAVTVAQHVAAVAAMREEVVSRPAYLARFLGCEDGSGDVADRDGDGFAWCNDCNDANGAANPAATEICGNGVDDDCDSFVDVAPACPAPAPGAPAPVD